MPKIIDHDAYRTQIIEHAVTLFVQHGYAGLGMRDLAKHLGVSKSALYHYFPTKEALFESVVDYAVGFDVAQLEQIATPDMTFAERLTALLAQVRAHEHYFAQQYLILTEYVRLRPSTTETISTRMAEAAHRYSAAIADFLGITEEEGRALYFQLTSIIMQRLFDNQHTSFHEALAWLIHELTARYGSPQE